MAVEIRYLEKLPECYQKVVKNLLKDLNEKETREEKRDLLHKFSESYTLIPPIWTYWYRWCSHYSSKCIEKFPCSSFDICRTYSAEDFKIIPKEYINTYLATIDSNSGSTNTYCRPTLKEKEEDLLSYLFYPHDRLKDIFKLYDENCCGQIPKEVLEAYHKNIDLFEQLKNSLDDPIKFFDTALKVEDEKSIAVNIELILGDHPYCKELWEKCFECAEKLNLFCLQSFYNRYCGIFLDDLEAIKKRDKLKSMSVGENEYIESSSFGKRFKYFNASDSKKIKKAASFVIKTPNFKNIRIQVFPFPTFMKNYINQKINPNLILKLQKSAKHFVQLFQFNILRRFSINDGRSNANTYKHSLNVDLEMAYQLPANIWLANAFFIGDIDDDKREHFDVISILMPKIVKSDLKYIRIYNQTMTFSDFKFLTKSGKVEILKLDSFNFDGENGEDVEIPLEDVLAEVASSIYYFSLSPCYITPKTAENLLNLKFGKKLKWFELSCLEEYFETENFVKFLKRNMDSGSLVSIIWDIQLRKSYELIPALKELDKNWHPKNESPCFKIWDLNLCYNGGDGRWELKDYDLIYFFVIKLLFVSFVYFSIKQKNFYFSFYFQ